MANIQITQLPAAGSITGTELVPIVQNGVTVQTTTGAIAASPSQTQTFLTKNQEPTLPNSRALSGGTGIGLVDGGAQSTLQITLNGTAGTLAAMGNGVAVNVAGTMTARSIAASGAGVAVTNGDGQSGNPTVALSGLAASLANSSGTGLLAVVNGASISGRQILGEADQISVANGNGSSNPVISIADNPVFPGTAGVTIPAGTTAERPTPATEGDLRYNTDDLRFEAYVDGEWQILGSGDGSVTSVSGTSNQITVVNTTTTPQVSITTNPVIPGSGSITVPSGNTASRPDTPVNGMFRYNSETGLFEGYLGGTWQAFTSGGGSGVTSVATGTGLTGGPITSTGTISIANTAVAAGSYGAASKTLTATVNAQGQLTAMAETPIAIANTQISGLGTMSTQNANAVAITGGTVNGTSVGATTPSTGAFTSVSMTSGTITTSPTNGTDIVNKDYADSIASGLNYHQPVNYASTTTLPAYIYSNGSSGVGATITANANGALSLGGGSPTVTQRVLVKDEVGGNAAYNGVYVVTQTGDLLAPFILTRATDYDTSGSGTNEIDQGDYVLVISGTLASTAWVQQTALPITVGTTALTFVQFNAPITYSAGTGLTLASTTFSITNTAVTSGSYGGAATVPAFSVNAQGQLTSASDVTIAIAASQITSGTLAVARGGTNFGSYTAGDLLYADTTTSLAKLGIGTSTYILTSSGTAPQYTDPASITVGTATTATTATNLAGGIASQIPYQTGAGATSFIANGTAGQVLTSAGTGTPTWSGISGGTF